MYGRFLAMRYKFNLVTYDQRPLVIGRRGGMERNLNEIRLVADNGRWQPREESSSVRARCDGVPVTVLLNET